MQKRNRFPDEVRISCKVTEQPVIQKRQSLLAIQRDSAGRKGEREGEPHKEGGPDFEKLALPPFHSHLVTFNSEITAETVEIALYCSIVPVDRLDQALTSRDKPGKRRAKFGQAL